MTEQDVKEAALKAEGNALLTAVAEQRGQRVSSLLVDPTGLPLGVSEPASEVKLSDLARRLKEQEKRNNERAEADAKAFDRVQARCNDLDSLSTVRDILVASLQLQFWCLAELGMDESILYSDLQTFSAGLRAAVLQRGSFDLCKLADRLQYGVAPRLEQADKSLRSQQKGRAVRAEQITEKLKSNTVPIEIKALKEAAGGQIALNEMIIFRGEEDAVRLALKHVTRSLASVKEALVYMHSSTEDDPAFNDVQATKMHAHEWVGKGVEPDGFTGLLAGPLSAGGIIFAIEDISLLYPGPDETEALRLGYAFHRAYLWCQKKLALLLAGHVTSERLPKGSRAYGGFPYVQVSCDAEFLHIDADTFPLNELK